MRHDIYALYKITGVLLQCKKKTNTNLEFQELLAQEYGIELLMSDGRAGVMGYQGYTIVNEQKYLMGILKFS
jgi:hypothetical protein